MTYFVYEKEEDKDELWVHDSDTGTYLPLERFELLMDAYKQLGRWPKVSKGEPKTCKLPYDQLVKVIENCKENYLHRFENYHYYYFAKAVEFIDLKSDYEEGISVSIEFLKKFDFSTIPITPYPELFGKTDSELTEEIKDIGKYFIKSTPLESNKIINMGPDEDGDILYLVMRSYGRYYIVMTFKNLDQAFARVALEKSN